MSNKFRQRQKHDPHKNKGGSCFCDFDKSLNSLFNYDWHINIENTGEIPGGERPESEERAVGVGGAEAVDCPHMPVVGGAGGQSA